DVIVNPKEVSGIPVIQLETAIGSALDCFEGARGVIVSRDRFLPVKKTSDLLLVQSDLYLLDEGRLKRNPQRQTPGLPRVCLGSAFSQLEDYGKRFPVIPSLLELDSLDI
ncbi:MAG: hypothetical protein GWM98_10110, partial [Nitrospinaceae bacterium]|nr:hypothetical protein [Nitrospinaceae bacterium]NIR54776.1 hypothetical protein [Nitrospinaceae bacterium]NIS85202.1 hypothetical protein [Nitrospinaceae bacterium]NIT82012.1 hypothetical protein [Nitrospinaceae bacterium]NIU44276.1 hypothetical protein [Nitrospinaceae bacterium]